MTFKSPSFKKLQAKWYKKIKDKGFEDIEKDEIYLNSFSGDFSLVPDELSEDDGKHISKRTLTLDYVIANGGTISSDIKAAYFRWCGVMLHSFKFKNKRIKGMFEMHSNGESLRTIGKKFKVGKDTVDRALKVLIKEMRGK